MPVRRTKRGCSGSSPRRRRSKRTITLSKRRSKRIGCGKSRNRRSMRGGSIGSRSLESVREVIDSAVARGQSGGKYGSSSGSSYGSSLYPNGKNMRRKSRRNMKGGFVKLIKKVMPKNVRSLLVQHEHHEDRQKYNCGGTMRFLTDDEYNNNPQNKQNCRPEN